MGNRGLVWRVVFSDLHGGGECHGDEALYGESWCVFAWTICPSVNIYIARLYQPELTFVFVDVL